MAFLKKYLPVSVPIITGSSKNYLNNFQSQLSAVT